LRHSAKVAPAGGARSNREGGPLDSAKNLPAEARVGP
jgi:hypothetical protein